MTKDMLRKEMPVDYFLIVFEINYPHYSEISPLLVGLTEGLLKLKLER